MATKIATETSIAEPLGAPRAKVCKTDEPDQQEYCVQMAVACLARTLAVHDAGYGQDRLVLGYAPGGVRPPGADRTQHKNVPLHLGYDPVDRTHTSKNHIAIAAWSWANLGFMRRP